MSFEQYFNEVEAVAEVLDGFVSEQEPDGDFAQSDVFTATWQALELLSRAYQVLLPLVRFEQSKVALLLPDVQQVPDAV